MKTWMGMVAFLWMTACAAAPVTQEEVDRAMGEADRLNAQYGTACVSLGFPQGSRPYFGCVLKFYDQEKPEPAIRRPVLKQALRQSVKQGE